MGFVSFLLTLIRKFWSFFSFRYLNQSFIRFTSITIILIGILNYFIAIWTSEGGLNIYGSWAGGDYSCFYIAGKILNDYSPSRLYDFHLQSELLHSLLPNISLTSQLPYINPPFFALIFKPLSRLPYMLSYFIWIFLSVVIYIFGFKLFWKTLDSMPPKTFQLALLLALSFEPFYIENLFGGNSSSIAFLAFSFYFYFVHLKKYLLAGFSLGILLYKPTFLIIILPMILIGHRLKIIFAFCTFSILLFLLSALAIGFENCIDYMWFLFRVSNKTIRSEVIFSNYKYVDILSFNLLLFETISPAGFILITISSLIPIIFLIKLWWKLNSLNKSTQELLQASTITLTIIINVHFAIYDTVILVLSILLTVNVFYRNSTFQQSNELTPVFNALLLSIYIFPWISQQVARIIGFQLFTIAIFFLMIYQILFTRAYCKFAELQ